MKIIAPWLRYGLGYLLGFCVTWAVPNAPHLLSGFYTAIVWLPEVVVAYFALRWATRNRYDDWRGRGPFAVEGVLVGLFPFLGIWPTYFCLNFLILLVGGIRYGLAALILIAHYLFTQKLRRSWKRPRPEGKGTIGMEDDRDRFETKTNSRQSASMRRRRITLTAVSALTICTLGALLLSRGWRTPEFRKFPDGFRGVAIIVWGIPGYPPLPASGGKIVEEFPSDGVIITSTQPQAGFAFDENYFLRPNGQIVPARDVSVAGVGVIKSGQKKWYSHSSMSVSAICHQTLLKTRTLKLVAKRRFRRFSSFSSRIPRIPS